MKNKKIFIIIIILSIITIIALGTYALSIWRSSEDTELTMRIGDIAEVYFDEGSDINIEGIGPIFDYEKDGISNSFKIKNLTTNEVVLNINLNITNISDALIHKSFKYVLMASETKEGIYEKVIEGDFSKSSSEYGTNGNGKGLNIATGYRLIDESYFKIIFYIDANLENPIEMQNAILEGYITVDAFPNYVMEGASKSINEIISESVQDTSNFLSTKILRNQIESITFDSFENIPENSIGEYDVSLAKNRSVLLYYTDNDNNNLYEVMIATESGTTVASSGYALFAFLTNMINIDLSNFDTSRVTNMHGMFAYSTSLKTLNVSTLNTSNVIVMRSMFGAGGDDYIGIIYKMSLEKIIGLEDFDTKKVVNMRTMFQNCGNLKQLNVSNFNTSNVTDMSHMFWGVKGLENIDVSNFNTSKVTNMKGMFGDRRNNPNILLTNIKGLENFDTSKVINIEAMFQNVGLLTKLNVSSFDTSSVTNFKNMFSGCTKLEKIYVSEKFKLTNVEDSSYMFERCNSLIGGKGTKFNSSKTDATYARIDGGTASPGYFTHINDFNYQN